MGLLNSLGKLFWPTACPLCGSASTYRVSGTVDYPTLISKLSQDEHWRKAHGLKGGGIPQAPAAYADMIKTISIPGFDRAKDSTDSHNDHRRCLSCNSLLPPEYWQGRQSIGNNFAITVTGVANAGKTTWLTNMLNPPHSDTYEIIRRTERLETSSYEYTEPSPLKILQAGGGRTNIPFVLFGTTVRFRKHLVFVRTLDIMGEQFRDYETETREVIRRHLSTTRAGALLVV